MMTVRTALIGVGICGVVLAGAVSLSWFGLVAERPMDKTVQAAESQIYSASQVRQQKINASIERDCQVMESELPASPEAKDFAKMVMADADGGKNLSSDASQCLVEAQRIVSIQ